MLELRKPFASHTFVLIQRIGPLPGEDATAFHVLTHAATGYTIPILPSFQFFIAISDTSSTLPAHFLNLPIMNKENTLKPTDLRGILKYVPKFRGHVFVIAIDGSIIDHENFANVVTDIAVLKSLNIKVILVHGIGCQLRAIAEEQDMPISNVYGDGPTDEITMQFALEASAKASQRILEGLTGAGLKCALSNAVRGAEKGIVKGESWGLTGQATNIDAIFIRTLIDQDVIPLIGPIILDREGRSLRGNSDDITAELAIQLKASKLIYLTPFSGLEMNEGTPPNLPVEELRERLAREKEKMEPRLFNKASCCIAALDAGVSRAHVLDGRIFGALLTEIFDKVGLGTMVHANDYQRIRPATPEDAQAIYNITRNSIETEALRYRTRESIEASLQHFYVYEIDDSVIACAALHAYENTKTMEVACVYVQPYYTNQGIGQQLVEFACAQAKTNGADKLIALSTQAYAFFTQVCQFTEGSIEDLPVQKREDHESSGRNSKVLVRVL